MNHSVGSGLLRIVGHGLLVDMLSVSTLLAEDPIKPGLQFQKQYRNLLELGEAGSFDETHAKYPCVLRVGKQWWMWYNGRAADCFTGQVGLAISDDGFKLAESKWWSACSAPWSAGSFDETKVDHPTVVYFNNRFHMWYTGGPGQDLTRSATRAVPMV